MANSKISALTAATTPVAGTEVLPIVQSSATVQVSIANLTPGLSTITAAKGGTGQTSYAVGDLLYASASTTLSKLADVATGNALISGGVTTAPSWGKVGLTTHVSGTLPTANGGTNLTSFTANGVVYASSTSALATGAALSFDGTNLSTTGSVTSAGLSNSLNLTFTGTGNRIIGDMSNATTANRLIFQTSTVNSNTNVTAMPNGSATASLFQALSSGSDPNNCSVGSFAVNGGADVRIAGAIKGTGTYLPIAFHTSGGEKAKIDTNGNVLVTNAGGLGYGTGAGGTVTQATSKATGVTLNKPTGQITMNNALLLTNTTVAFALSNTLIAESDTLILNITNASAGGGTGGGNYNIWSTPYAGGTNIWLKNISAGSLSEALVVNFSLIKGATA